MELFTFKAGSLCFGGGGLFLLGFFGGFVWLVGFLP